MELAHHFQRVFLDGYRKSLQVNTSFVNLYRRTFHINSTLNASKKDASGKKNEKEKQKDAPVAKKGFTKKKEKEDGDDQRNREDDGDAFVDLVKAGTARVKSKEPLRGEEREQYEKYRLSILDHLQTHNKDLEVKRQLQWEAFNDLPDEFKEAASKPDKNIVPDSPYYWIATREVPPTYPPRRILY